MKVGRDSNCVRDIASISDAKDEACHHHDRVVVGDGQSNRDDGHDPSCDVDH